jgi:hypothetical protein
MVRNPSARKYKLPIMANSVQALGQGRENPSAYFSPIAQPISNSPATHKENQPIAPQVSFDRSFVNSFLQDWHSIF